jgi:miniconductance mechanosensitive channel
MEQIHEFIFNMLSYVITINESHWIVSFVEMLFYTIISFGVVFIFKSTIVKYLRNIIEQTKSSFGQYLVDNRLFTRLVNLFPMAFLFGISDNLKHPAISELFSVVLHITFVYLSIALIFSVLNSLMCVVENHKRLKEISIKPVIQLIKILLCIIGIIIVVAKIMGSSPDNILTALGGISAVLLLIFKDTLLNFVGYIQIATQKLLKRGDWIVVSKYGADGDVIEISLNNIRIKNWDKTIVSVPTYEVVNGGLINYSNMSKEGRRIKRSVNIDANTIRPLINEDITKMSEIKIIKEYIEDKMNEHLEFNKDLPEEQCIVNGRQLTNVGTFRKYLEYYINHHSGINKSHTILIRQLDPSSEGIPIQIYCFTTDTAWGVHEGIKSDIFDHILTVLPYFGLKMYQKPSGNDFHAFSK